MKQQKFISCQKDELSRCILGAWQAAAIPIIHFYGTKSQSTDLVPHRLGGGERRVASIFLISIFHPVLPLSVSLFAFSNHKSLLDTIATSVLQWKGGRIDSRVEDERGERRGAVKRLPWLTLTENILIAKLNLPASH